MLIVFLSSMCIRYAVPWQMRSLHAEECNANVQPVVRSFTFRVSPLPFAFPFKREWIVGVYRIRLFQLDRTKMSLLATWLCVGIFYRNNICLSRGSSM